MTHTALNDQILAAASTHIRTHGYPNASLPDIATEAGVPLDRLIELFPTRTDVLRGLLEPLHTALQNELLAQPIRVSPTPADKRRLLDAIVRTSLEHRPACVVTLLLADADVAAAIGPDATRHLFYAGGIRLIGPDYDTDAAKRTRTLAAFGAIAHIMGSRLAAPLDTEDEIQGLVDGLVAMVDF